MCSRSQTACRFSASASPKIIVSFPFQTFWMESLKDLGLATCPKVKLRVLVKSTKSIGVKGSPCQGSLEGQDLLQIVAMLFYKEGEMCGANHIPLNQSWVKAQVWGEPFPENPIEHCRKLFPYRAWQWRTVYAVLCALKCDAKFPGLASMILSAMTQTLTKAISSS